MGGAYNTHGRDENAYRNLDGKSVGRGPLAKSTYS
jgi:hypothetical protein